MSDEVKKNVGNESPDAALEEWFDAVKQSAGKTNTPSRLVREETRIHATELIERATQAERALGKFCEEHGLPQPDGVRQPLRQLKASAQFQDVVKQRLERWENTLAQAVSLLHSLGARLALRDEHLPPECEQLLALFESQADLDDRHSVIGGGDNDEGGKKYRKVQLF